MIRESKVVCDNCGESNEDELCFDNEGYLCRRCMKLKNSGVVTKAIACLRCGMIRSYYATDGMSLMCRKCGMPMTYYVDKDVEIRKLFCLPVSTER